MDLQEQLAVKQLEEILCQLYNCRSFKISTAARSQRHLLQDELTHEEAVAVLMDIVTRTGLPVRSFKEYFWGMKMSVSIDHLVTSIRIPETRQ